MQYLTPDNPVFVTYAIAAALMVVKLMGQGWLTVYRMMKSDSGLVNPEDLRQTPLNPHPRDDQLELNDYVDRSRRMHRNDLENIPGFWAAGLLFVFAAPPLWLAQGLMYGFVGARLLHAWAYLSKQNHEVRATFYTIGSVIVIYMALHALVALLG
ncbi:MAPEG family protein [Thalassovita aquimarina]|uniref:Microsomal glutathione S-transferase 1 n=1 Tax=Thalassovita aquimarina TaxID=2785917 RepID=A0ABS5HSM9_9RHOB|nr:MAPEG family protein [Thalassovita aquimarina]MBR9651866.1 MAPEG family protein [Thalassovita aquimarina]